MEFDPHVQALFSSRDAFQAQTEALGLECTGSGMGLGAWVLEFETDFCLVFVDYVGSGDPASFSSFSAPDSGGGYNVRFEVEGNDVFSLNLVSNVLSSSTFKAADEAIDHIRNTHNSFKTRNHSLQ